MFQVTWKEHCRASQIRAKCGDSELPLLMTQVPISKPVTVHHTLRRCNPLQPVARQLSTRTLSHGGLGGFPISLIICHEAVGLGLSNGLKCIVFCQGSKMSKEMN